MSIFILNDYNSQTFGEFPEWLAVIGVFSGVECELGRGMCEGVLVLVSGVNVVGTI